MIENVFLVEYPDEGRAVFEYVKRHKLEASNFKIIGIGPRVRAFLKNRGIASSDTLEFFGNLSQEKILRKSHKLCELIENHFQ